MTPDPEQRLPRELLKELIEEGSDAFRGVLEKLLNTAMQMEREEFLGARRWERSEQRRDHANGYKAKTLSTRVGQLQIRIPQVRHLDFYPRSLERGCRSEKALKLAIAEMYVMGVSTRKVTEITEQLCGTEISASQVSRISKLLDDELEQFRNRPLGSYPVVYLDAHYEKVRRQGSIQDVAVLKATGVNCWGKREVIGVSCRLSEAEVHWREFLQQLQKRGLEGVQLIVSDDHSGLRAARRAVFPSVPWQRCQFHLSQNAQRYARRSDQRAAIATDIRDIFNAPSGGEAEAMRRCCGPESSNTTTATRSWPIGWRPICRKALRSFVLHVLPGGAFAPTTGWRTSTVRFAGVPGSSVSFQTPSPHYDSSPLSSRRFTKTG